jgi:CheY-like chemotaxis protein
MKPGPILVIDDNPQSLKLTTVILVGEGYEVRTAVNAEEALTMLESFTPPLIITDVQLPRMDGLELTRRIKAHPATRHVIVVALTASAMIGVEERAIAAGCDGYITKPIDTTALPVIIAGHLSRRGVVGPDR